MKEQVLFKEKAIKGYTVCTSKQCPIKDKCLRWKVGQQMPDNIRFYSCVNPHYQDVGTKQCPSFRKSEKVKFAKGMTNIFTDDMPQRVVTYVRQYLISAYCRTYYFEYRNGQRLIPPAIQEEIRTVFRDAGWNKEVFFDGYVEDYEW